MYFIYLIIFKREVLFYINSWNWLFELNKFYNNTLIRCSSVAKGNFHPELILFSFGFVT